MAEQGTTQIAFFYGTLMHPRVLARVIENSGTHLQICPGVLLNHTRHRVKGVDYPGVIPYSKGKHLFTQELLPEEILVRGTLVRGLTESDIEFLDDFEGDGYVRRTVCVHPLANFEAFKFSNEPLLLSSSHSHPFPDISQLAPPMESSTYIYLDIDDLDPEPWSFEDFVKNKASDWFRLSGNQRYSSPDEESRDEEFVMYGNPWTSEKSTGLGGRA